MSRVLVVDDEALIRSSIVHRIDNCNGMTMVSGSEPNGKEALQWLDDHYVDICVTDVRMPKMDGIELIRRIKELYPWMACIVVSSYDEFDYVKQCLQLGAKDYILKPVDQNVLHQAVTRLEMDLDKTRYREATELLVRHMDYRCPMMDRWMDQVQTMQGDSIPLLVEDTLDMLETWVKGKYYLLPMLSRIWIHKISESMKLPVSMREPDNAGSPFKGQKTIPMAMLRDHFRLYAGQKLEEGAKALIDRMIVSRASPGHKVIQQVKAYIQAHYASKICLQELADNVNISRTYLSNMFRKETGLTIWNYLLVVRMEKAREMLLNTSLRSYEIANKVGYENSIHFSQLFKAHFGLNPMEYKKRMEK